MNELEFLWLSQYVGIDYYKYIELIKVFGSIEKIYENSNNNDIFIKKLKLNKVYLKSDELKRILSFEEKYKAKIKMMELKQKDIEIITIKNKKYSKYLNNEYILFVYGDINLLESKKISIYNSNNVNMYSKKILNDFINILSNFKISIVSDILDENTNIYCSEILTSIKRDKLLNLSNKIETEINRKSKVDIKIQYKIMSNVSLAVFYIPINYDLKAVTLLDVFLENGKDILVVPGDIYNKDTYFTNFLIKCGATVITSKKDILYEINYLSNLNCNTLL